MRRPHRDGKQLLSLNVLNQKPPLRPRRKSQEVCLEPHVTTALFELDARTEVDAEKMSPRVTSKTPPLSRKIKRQDPFPDSPLLSLRLDIDVPLETEAGLSPWDKASSLGWTVFTVLPVRKCGASCRTGRVPTCQPASAGTGWDARLDAPV